MSLPHQKTTEVKPINPANIKKAISTGKSLMKNKDTTKADAARSMYEIIHTEPREIIVQAFIDGCNLTPMGVQTYYYNCKRKMKK